MYNKQVEMPSFVSQKRKQEVCYLQGTQSIREQVWQSELGHGTVLVSQLGAMLRHLAQAAFAALSFCLADHVPSNTRGKRARSHQDHSKILEVTV